MSSKRAVWLATITLLATFFTAGAHSARAAQTCVSSNGAGGCFTSIQQAVDAAANGTTIIIKAGTYTEQVTIDGKDLTLAGQKGAILQAPNNMVSNLDPDATGYVDRAIIGVLDATVTIRALTIDGLNSGEANPKLAGIFFINAGGEIRKNVVKNIGFGEPRFYRDVNGDGVIDYEGYPIQVVNLDTTARHVTIAENTVINYNTNGITVRAFEDPSASSPTALSVDIRKNTVVGSGLTNQVDQYGIQVGPSEGNAIISGKVAENKVSDNATTPDAPFAAYGIIAYYGPNDVAIDKNVLVNNTYGIGVYFDVNVDVVKNKITGPGPEAAGYYGVDILSENTQVHENRFTNLQFGIYVGPGSVNTTIYKNTFKAVGTPVLDESAMAALRRGTTLGQR